jgi:DNA primase
VIEANNIVDIISQYTQLKPGGSNLMGLCPFPDHNEKTPSFSVSASKQLYHCFGCKKSGNIIGFLQNYNGMSFPETIEFLANKAGIPIPAPEVSPEQRQNFQKKKDEKQQLLRVNELARNRFQTNFQQAPIEIKNYAKARKLNEEIIEKFQIGYAKDSWDDLSQFFVRNSVNAKQAIDLGLIKKRNKGSGNFDIFRHRLIFPILSPSKDVIGFGGRVLKKEDNPKYLNSPESLVFHKGKSLYGLHETAKHILTEDKVIVVEGYMDLLALYAAGIKNTVANLGTAFTADHAKLLKRYTKNVVLMFDGDNAGQLAAERAMPILLKEGLYSYGMNLPDELDPEEFIDKNGVEALNKLLQKPQDLYFWFLNRTLKSFDLGPAGQIKIIDRLFPVLSAVADVRLRELYLKETADRIGVEERWLRDTLRQMWVEQSKSNKQKNMSAKETSFSQGNTPVEAEKSSNSKYLDLTGLPPYELELLKLSLSSEKILKSFLGGSDFAYLQSEVAKEIFAEIGRYYGQEANNFDKLPALVVAKLRDPSVITQILNGDFYEDEDRVRKMYDDCVRRLRVNATKNQLKALKSGLRDGLPEDKLQEFMKVISSHKSETKNS